MMRGVLQALLMIKARRIGVWYYFMTTGEKISSGKCFLGIEFGSTRIKAVLTDDQYKPAAMGEYQWENRFEGGYWTYPLDEIRKGLSSCYSDLKRNTAEKFGVGLSSFRAMGISGMMHGYMPFDSEWNLLVPFRTWRNTNTGEAAAELTRLFGFNIPQRWSIAHLYQAILDKEEHIGKISYITTLAVYVHRLLTGVTAAGIGEASGMFPVKDAGYNEEMLDKFSEVVSDAGLTRSIRDMLPKVMLSGEKCGVLSAEGALLLDSEGNLKAGIPFCPPEGDAGTGMTATDSVRAKTGNVSAGTSVFAMAVLEKPLSGVYPEIDVVATPDGRAVAMVHCNNCCCELDAWIGLFEEFCGLAGIDIGRPELYRMLYGNAMKGDADCGGAAAYNFLSAEPVAGVDKGKPMYFRSASGKFNLANFFRAELMGSLASLKMGMDILFGRENVRLERLSAHGGLFKVPGAADVLLADGLNVPVTVTEAAGEGGAWGMSLLAAYMADGGGCELGKFLSEKVFDNIESREVLPSKEGVIGFDRFMKNYAEGLKAVKAMED